MGRLKGVLALSLLALVASAGASFADRRTQNIDVIVALDRSLSMEDKIGAVRRYATDNLVDQVLIPGDFLVVVAFYGKAEVVVSQFVRTEADRASVKAAINGLQGNGRWTDIGNALDALQEQVAKYENDGRRKYVLLMTDGIQEAPPSSRYWSADGSFNHALLENTKVIQQKGWKIHILGIGLDTAAQELARALGGSYEELTGTVTADTIRQQTENLLGTIRADTAAARLSSVGPDRSSVLTLRLASDGYASPVRIAIEGVTAAIDGGAPFDALVSSPQSIEVPAAGATTTRIALQLPAELAPGTRSCQLTFRFLAGESFIPATFTLPLTVRGWTVLDWAGSNPLPAIGAGVGVLAALAALVLLVLLLVRGRRVRFVVLVDRERIGERPSGLRRGGRLYLSEVDGDFSLIANRTARSLAFFQVRGDRLAMEFLKPDRFPKVDQPPVEARGATLPVKASDGSRHELKIQSQERAH